MVQEAAEFELFFAAATPYAEPARPADALTLAMHWMPVIEDAAARRGNLALSEGFSAGESIRMVVQDPDLDQRTRAIPSRQGVAAKPVAAWVQHGSDGNPFAVSSEHAHLENVLRAYRRPGANTGAAERPRPGIAVERTRDGRSVLRTS